MMRLMVLGLVGLLALPLAARADCVGGTLAAGATCHAGTCNSGSGTNFTGMCIAGQGATTTLPATTIAFTPVRCGSSASICASGPFGMQGCANDSQCATGQVCVSDNGPTGCGTGYAVCMTTCSG